MKRFLSLAVIFLIAALFFFTAALAQEPAVAPSPAGTTPSKKEPAKPLPDQPGIQYKRVWVVQGGNLALISERCGHRQTEWPDLYGINKDTLPKPYLKDGVWYCMVHPGQTLNLPVGWNYSALDPEYVVPFPPAPKEAAAAEGTVKPVIGIGDTDSNRSLWWLPNWLLALLVLLAALALIFWFAGGFQYLPPIILSRRRNPARYPAVIPGGLADDPLVATDQVADAYQGLTTNAESAEVGYFVNDSGPDRVLVGMTIQGGEERQVYLLPGQPVFRLLRNGRAIWHSLMRCGNALRLTPPRGWRFVVGQAVNIPQPIPPVPPTPPVPPVPPASTQPAPAPEPTPAPAPAPTPEPEPEPAPAEPLVTVAEGEHVEHTLTSNNEVEVTVDGFMIMVVGKNGNIPATKIRTGGGVKVTIQKP